MINKINIFIFISTLSLALGADPCFDNGPDPVTGDYANCIPAVDCVSEPVAINACPSYPGNFACCYHKTFPGREHRGLWIASVTHIDWPTSTNSSVGVQQEQLIYLLNETANAGFNAIYFQVRPAGDALYQSAIEPWSIYLVGPNPQGTPPSPWWDPLQVAIEFCKPRNIEVHAWINPYRAALLPLVGGLAPNHMAAQFPQFAYVYSDYLWMDPGAEVVQNRTFEVALDLVTRYDLDGLHMDDYFYPYPATGWTFPDNETYNEYLVDGGVMNKEDWRRENVNKLIRRLNTGLHQAKPWIVFSVSPFGIFRAGHPEGHPRPITGFDQYSEIYCDAKLWLQQGWLDVLQPQLYWRIDPPEQSYPLLLQWWVNATQNPMGRHVYAGMYLSRVDLQDWPVEEIFNQIGISRLASNRLGGSWGNVQFSAMMIRDNIQNITNYFKSEIYRLPAFQPEFPWLSNATYANIKRLQPSVKISKGDSAKLEISVMDSMDDLNTMDGFVHKLGIYKEEEKVWILFKIVQIQNKLSLVDVTLPKGSYATSLVNRFGQESKKTYFEVY